MVAVVLSSVEKLGSFEAFTLALAAAGLIQLAAGLGRIGFISSFFPKNVIRGLLVSIGIILILKQIPHAVGLDSSYEGDFSFFQEDGENTFSELWRARKFISPAALTISVLSIIILIIWPKIKHKWIQNVPPYLVVVLAGIGINYFLQSFFPALAVSNDHLVSLPSIDNFTRMIPEYDYSLIFNAQFWLTALTIAVVASIETLLNLEAADNLDPERRLSPSNRELIAQGAGNVLSGLLGGIPLTSVVVRTSVSINAGSKSKTASILHGFWLLAGFLFFTRMINLIPYASLAGILLISGYKLAKIEIFRNMYRLGWSQFIPFVATIVAIVFTDLLQGVLLGLLISIFYLLKTSIRIPVLAMEGERSTGEVLTLTLPSQVSFLNKARIKRMLKTIPEGQKLCVDASEVLYMDADVKEILRDFISSKSKRKGVLINYHGSQEENGLPTHVEYTEVLDKESQRSLQPFQVLEILRAGNSRFIQGKMFRKHFGHQVLASSASQSPMAVILSCIDSRTSPDIIFDAGLGDILSIRIAGNVVTPEIAGSVELAVRELGVRLIVILGHSNCGAISYALSTEGTGNIRLISDQIRLSSEKFKPSDDNSDGFSATDRLAIRNLQHSVHRLRELSPYLSSEIGQMQIALVAGFYDTGLGSVLFYPPDWLES
jgi:MFS superfamily sulfate permease-like transporter